MARCKYVKAAMTRRTPGAENGMTGDAADMEEGEEEENSGTSRGGRGKAAKKAAREEARMLGLGSYASDEDADELDSDEEDGGETESEEDVEESDEDDGTTNIYPGTGDAEVDGVGQHCGTQMKIEGMTWGGCSVAQFATVRVLVSCTRCTHDEEATVSRHRAFEAQCGKCCKDLRVRLRPDVLHRC